MADNPRRNITTVITAESLQNDCPTTAALTERDSALSVPPTSTTTGIAVAAGIAISLPPPCAPVILLVRDLPDETHGPIQSAISKYYTFLHMSWNRHVNFREQVAIPSATSHSTLSWSLPHAIDVVSNFRKLGSYWFTENGMVCFRMNAGLRKIAVLLEVMLTKLRSETSYKKVLDRLISALEINGEMENYEFGEEVGMSDVMRASFTNEGGYWPGGFRRRAVYQDRQKIFVLLPVFSNIFIEEIAIRARDA